MSILDQGSALCRRHCNLQQYGTADRPRNVQDGEDSSAESSATYACRFGDQS